MSSARYIQQGRRAGEIFWDPGIQEIEKKTI